MSEPKMGPTQYKAEIERLQREGKMPALEAVLKAVAESRTEYRGAILEARSETLDLNDYDRTFLNELRIEIPEDSCWPLDGD